MKRKIFMLLCFLSSLCTMAQKHLDKLPEAERNAILIELAKKAVKRFAPGYYREYGTPIIKRYCIDESDFDAYLTEKYMKKMFGMKKGRVFYEVTFPYDEDKEEFYNGYSAQVCIWADNRKYYIIGSGNTPGYKFRRDADTIKVIPYVEWRYKAPNKLYRDK